jgi:hypothetical protein
MKKRHMLMNKIKKKHVLPTTEKVSDVLQDYVDNGLDSVWQEEKSRRLNIQKWRRFKHQTF